MTIGHPANVPETREEWAQLRDTLDAATRQETRAQRRESAALPEAQSLRQQIADIERRGEEIAWTATMRLQLTALKRELAAVERSGEESLGQMRARYAWARASNWSLGLTESQQALAEAIADRAQAEGLPVPPEVAHDWPDLALVNLVGGTGLG